MNLKTILNKINDGTKLIMAVPTLIFKNKGEALIEAEHIVSGYEVARPDLIAAKYYGSAEGMDIILKYNNISDPFSIKKDDRIIVPVSDIPLVKYNRPAEVEENLVKQQFIDTKRLSTRDKKRVQTLQKKYGKENILPPNVVPVGNKTYKFERGNVIFGAQAQNDQVVDKIINDTNIASTSAVNNDQSE